MHSNGFVLISKAKNYSFQNQLNLPSKSCTAHALFLIFYYLRIKYISFFRYFHVTREEIATTLIYNESTARISEYVFRRSSQSVASALVDCGYWMCNLNPTHIYTYITRACIHWKFTRLAYRGHVDRNDLRERKTKVDKRGWQSHDLSATTCA